ncbi:TraX family protein [Ramlibacter rhizophilus]|uniref:Conjugal transfer protein TraX n=1 Tax=Ramlibacter rhizophilus TaxID=1781167 RepID=A0A4Z0C215_9BURK|nr:TraX family protein [Ramlibacter rhizophilus]TFZ04874.1 hypothetical protein EZ242_03765 [Ramlibacter rhizophilus]
MALVTPSPSPPPWGFSDGQLEALKWIAVGFMFLDHIGRLLLGYSTHSWVFAASRVAFPLFAIILALNLARGGDRAARAARTARRLGLWCVIAIAPSVWARGSPELVNVLGTLALGSALCWALASRGALALRVGVTLAATAAGHFVEFGIAGVLLIPAVFMWAGAGRAEAGLLALLLLGVTAWFNAVFGGVPAFLGTLACIPIAWALRQLPLRMPRAQLAFYVLYPLHLAVIGALKAA